VVRYVLLLDDVLWLNLLLEVAVFILPTVTPFLTIGLCKPYLQRASEIFRYCTGNVTNNQ